MQKIIDLKKEPNIKGKRNSFCIRKTSNGITLTVLVVTIIVLLILAGTTISLTGKSGILDRATTAVDKTNTENVKEQVQVIVSKYMSEYYQESLVDRNNSEDMNTYLNRQFTENSNKTNEGYIINVTTGGDVVVKDDNKIIIQGKINESKSLIDWD